MSTPNRDFDQIATQLKAERQVQAQEVASSLRMLFFEMTRDNDDVYDFPPLSEKVAGELLALHYSYALQVSAQQDASAAMSTTLMQLGNIFEQEDPPQQ